MLRWLLGHVVGQGQFAPVITKTEAISRFAVPADKKELTRFLGMAGYYHKFYHNFSTLTEPLTVLLRKGEMFSWFSTYEETLDKIKSILFSKPVLMTPSLRNHLVCLCLQVWVLSCCKKMPTYWITLCATIPENSMVINIIIQLWRRRHWPWFFPFGDLKVYLSCSVSPVTNHNPLTYIQLMKNHNKGLLHWSLIMQE